MQSAAFSRSLDPLVIVATSGIGGDVGVVAAPDLIGRLGQEVALQQVCGSRQIVFTVWGDDKLCLAL